MISSVHTIAVDEDAPVKRKKKVPLPVGGSFSGHLRKVEEVLF